MIRVWYVVAVGDALTGDEAVVGLMALKIASGAAFPLLMWGAHYTGTLLSFAAALVLPITGPTPVAVRLIALPFALIAVLATALTAHRLWGRGPALAAATWLALGSPVMLFYAAQGGVAETVSAASLILWLSTRLALDEPTASRRRPWLALGVLGGFGTYSFGLVAPVWAGALVVLARRGALSKARAIVTGLGFAIGFAPFIAHNVVHPAASILRLGGRVFGIARADVTDTASVSALIGPALGAWLLRVALFPLRLVEGLPEIVGVPAGLGRGVIIVAVIIVVLVVARRAGNRAPPTDASSLGRALIVAPAVTGLAFLALLGLDLPRHLVALYPVVALGVAAAWAAARPTAIPLAALVLALNLASLARGPAMPYPSVRELDAWLQARGVSAVYTDYSIAYPLLFLSNERIMASPTAGPVNVDRYPAYTRAVAASATPPAYVFLRETDASRVFTREMERAGRPFERAAVGAFDVYLPASAVRPDMLPLLRTFGPPRP